MRETKQRTTSCDNMAHCFGKLGNHGCRRCFYGVEIVARHFLANAHRSLSIYNSFKSLQAEAKICMALRERLDSLLLNLPILCPCCVVV